MCVLGWVLALWCYLAGSIFMVEHLETNKPFMAKTHERTLNTAFVVIWPLIILVALLIFMNSKARR